MATAYPWHKVLSLTFRLRIVGFAYLFFAALSTSGQSVQSKSLSTGDLVFLGMGESDLSKAISGVTQTEKQTSYSHIGMVVVDGNQAQVIHSCPSKGVVMEPLDSFILTVSGGNCHAYRFSKNVISDFSAPLAIGKSLLGEPYNFSYVMEDEGLYCSELIYEMFASDSVFALSPMSFKVPGKDEYLTTWKEHYESLEMAVPEGKPGCNPNGMAAHSELVYLGKLELATVRR